MWKKIFFYKILKDESKGLSTHAQLPTVLCFPDFVRVFFATRNANQYSSIYYIDMSFLNEDVKVLTDKPVLCLAPGDIGFFDEHGVFPSSVVYINGKYHLYYIGWNKGVVSPLFYTSIGLAISDDGKAFTRFSPAPIMARSEYDPCLVTSPHIYIDDGGYRMTYVSGVKWTQGEAGLQSHYHIKHATSEDGYEWVREGRIAIDFAVGETNIARSSVVKNGPNDYQMWFSYVGTAAGKYRIGYASSYDGWSWVRDDAKAAINVGSEGCEEMICYPCVFDYAGCRYMLFNGDSYGRDGFGVALLEK